MEGFKFGGWRPVGAKRVAVPLLPYADTVLPMPTNMRTAAVEHRAGRGNGPVLVIMIGAKMAQQLENATIWRQLPNFARWSGSHDKLELPQPAGGSALLHACSIMFATSRGS